MRRVILCVCVAMSAFGCGPAALPEPTKRNVVPGDIVGTWGYSADYGKIAVAIDLKPDGTFHQTIKRPSVVQEHRGNWSLDGSHPKLTLLKPEPGHDSKDWIIADAHWWIVESRQKGTSFAIYGAADDSDPDSAYEFAKIK